MKTISIRPESLRVPMLILRTLFSPHTFKLLPVSLRFLFENCHPANDPIQLSSVLRDQRITALGRVAVRHIVFFANVYSLCVCLAYVCASVFINRTFRKSLPPASSASLKRITAAGRGGGGGREVGGGIGPESHTDSNTFNNVGECISFQLSKSFQPFYLNYRKA